MTVNQTSNYVDVICTSVGSPATNVVWLRNGRVFQDIYKQIILDRSSSEYQNVLRVSITELSSRSYGCNVSNSLGWDEGHLEISKLKSGSLLS